MIHKQEALHYLRNEKGLAHIIAFRFFFPIFFIFIVVSVMIGVAIAAKLGVISAAREAGRVAAVTSDQGLIRQAATDQLTKIGFSLVDSNGTELFNPMSDVVINLNDGDYVTVTVTYHHHLIAPDIATIAGSISLGPLIPMTSSMSFLREW